MFTDKSTNKNLKKAHNALLFPATGLFIQSLKKFVIKLNKRSYFNKW